jgi:hypothetical protein
VVEGAVFRLCDFLSNHQRKNEKELYILYYTPSYADKDVMQASRCRRVAVWRPARYACSIGIPPV